MGGAFEQALLERYSFMSFLSSEHFAMVQVAHNYPSFFDNFYKFFFCLGGEIV